MVKEATFRNSSDELLGQISNALYQVGGQHRHSM